MIILINKMKEMSNHHHVILGKKCEGYIYICMGNNNNNNKD